MSSAICLNLDQSKILSSGNGLNLSQTSPSFVCLTSLLNTLWEKEKLLVKSNFSFSHGVFYPFRELSAIFNQIQNCRLQTLSVLKSLKFAIWETVNE